MTTIPSTADAAASPVASPHRARLNILAAVILLISIALPFVFLTNSASWAHAVFHILGIATCIGGIAVQRGLRRGTTRAVTVLSWIVTVLLVGWLAGHVGELSIVMNHGGLHADESVFSNPAHEFSAAIAVPSWALSVLATIVLLATVGVQALRRRAK